MNSLDTTLPDGFKSLEPYVASWSAATAAGRTRLRLTSTAEDRATFFNAAIELLPAALERLDRKPLVQLDAPEQRLMNLLLTFAHVSLAVEVQKDIEPQHADLRRHISISRAPADEQPAPA